MSSKCDQTNDTTKIIDENNYMSMVGALRYAADSTRPDIAFTTSILARHLTNPGPEHYEAFRHCYQYLKGTMDHWLVLGGRGE